ncbi:carbohydrate porin [Eleftheria terrae]|uniref:carbohydrate porin n=1 Tax=Eleftheria terrae TaxID=1597781 RepID=UPI00263BE725|nr:carbohydrate porin [Eleftheria terrae]WKB52725.1 carbohydrate porin [Eleftheria terrae]
MFKHHFRLSAMALALLGAMGASAADLEFSGYSRAGVGVNAEGGKQVCYKLAGADTKWRLGNECDYVIEPSFVTTVAKSEEYGTWKAHFMPSAYRAWGTTEKGTDSDELLTRFGQVYFYGDLAQLNGGRVWAGRRFYDRVQLGINDHFLESHDSDGAGIEDINLGFGKFSYAFLTDPRAGAGAPEYANSADYQHALRLTGLKTLPNSELSIYAGFAGRSRSDVQTSGAPVKTEDKKNGQRLGLYHVTKGTLGGATFVGLKYDRHYSAVQFNDQDYDITGQWRAVVQQQGQLTSMRTGWDFIAEYRTRRISEHGREKWYSIGGRTDTQIAGPFRFLAELGHDQVRPDSGDTQRLTKLTLALAASAGPTNNSRPTVRMFVTHARWNEAARDQLGDNVARVFGDKKSGTSFGLQGEAWW